MAEINNRCWWAGEDALYQRYHDLEWGVPQHDDRALFELLSLELFQAGLSWLTILRKRENFRAAFCEWSIPAIAAFGDDDVARLLSDAGIVRHQGKIRAVITNARSYQTLVAEVGSLDAFAWSFEPQSRRVPPGGFTRDSLPLLVDEAKAMSRALKKNGFVWVGPMTCMSFMQAAGILNDHVRGCDLCRYV